MPVGHGAKLKNNEKKACPRKQRHRTAQDAITAAEYASLEFAPEKYVGYWCRWCKGYHVCRASTIVNANRRYAVNRAISDASREKSRNGNHASE